MFLATSIGAAVMMTQPPEGIANLDDSPIVVEETGVADNYEATKRSPAAMCNGASAGSLALREGSSAAISPSVLQEEVSHYPRRRCRSLASSDRFTTFPRPATQALTANRRVPRCSSWVIV